MKGTNKRKLVSIVIATCLLLAPSVILVGCSDNSVLSQYNYTEDADMIQLSNWQFTSGVANNEITVDFADSDVVVCCSSDSYGFWQDNSYSSSVNIAVGEAVCWNMACSGTAGDSECIDIRLYSGDNVVAFAVVEATLGDDGIYNATVVKSVTFTKQNGQYQNITDSQVDEIIASL